jgi:predicted nucleotide-binding protein (sugar kinase/HSP70/actin superfamily)
MDNSLVHSYPQMIEAALMQLADTSEQLADVREQLRDAELEALGAATDARTEDGSKPLHTNDKARELAARHALKADESYRRDKATERILERKKIELEAQTERLRREYRISLIEYEAQMLGHRAA